MNEGAWITSSGQYIWVFDHAWWIRRPQNARLVGLPEPIRQRLAEMDRSWGRSTRRDVLLEVMTAGLIRVRGHGVWTTFEARIPIPQMISTGATFMAANFGPLMGCRFNDLETGASWEGLYRDLAEALGSESLAALLRKGNSTEIGGTP